MRAAAADGARRRSPPTTRSPPCTTRPVEAVTPDGLAPGPGEEKLGLGTDDNPVFAGMHLAAAHVVGATLEAFRQVWSGESLHSASIMGGLHHAMRDRASGFCVYNDVAIGIQSLLDQGAERVAYVDVDVHHGDGVERIFWNDPRVLTISLHESGQFLFPGTGETWRRRGRRRPRHRGQRAAAARHRRRGLAAGLPRRRAAARAGLRPRGAGHPARLRLPRRRPAGPPHAQRRRAARGLPRPARPRPRGRRRPLGRDRRRRLRPGAGRAARVDPPARRRRRRAARPRRPTRRRSWREHVRPLPRAARRPAG